MPELPEVEIMRRRLGEQLGAAVIQKVVVRGLSTLKTFEPPIEDLVGGKIVGLFRRGKHLAVSVSNDLVILLHLMSAGRIQVFPTPATPGDRKLRIGIDLEDGRQIRLREFGTQQAAWVKLLDVETWQDDPAIANLGPEAWPGPPDLKEILNHPRPLHSLLRDQRVVAGIGRSWVDEILHTAQLSPYKRGSDLDGPMAKRLRNVMIEILAGAIDHYERNVTDVIPDKLPMPLTVHRKNGSPCPRCGSVLQAVHFESYVIAYCPDCQTEGKILKDRRMSRLLK